MDEERIWIGDHSRKKAADGVGAVLDFDMESY